MQEYAAKDTPMTPEEQAAADTEAARKAAETQQTPEQIAAAEEASRKANADNASRRLLEAANKRIKDLEDADQARKDAELSETDRLKKEAADSKKALDEARLESLRLRVGKDLPEEALEFLIGTDEATLTAQAEKLRKVYKAAPAAAGTITNPAANQGPTLDERITAAEKAGDRTLSIQLKREKAFGVKS